MMRKQILKSVTMLMLVVTVGFMTAVASANGQTRTVFANVPFEFNVGESALPAGECSVKAMTSGAEALAIRSQASNKSAVRLSTTIMASKAPEKTKLVFRRYNQQYFLAEVWHGGESIGRRLLKSKQERAIESQLAAIPSKSDVSRSNYELVEIVAIVR
jgi:hypothetical protein